MRNPRNSTRRAFLASSLAGAAAAATAPSDRVTVGIIGSGGRAIFETRQYPFFDNVEIVAVCDAQESRRLSAKSTLEKLFAEVRPAGSYRGIRMYADFRELLAQKDIDAVYIASPDHWHVSMLIPALKAGKHVHCEKPLGVSIEQDLAALKAVRQSKTVFQYGAERRSTPDARKGIELVLNGRIGKVTKVYAVAPPSSTGGSPTPVTQPPPGFDYDMWLGPAPMQALLRRPLPGRRRAERHLQHLRLHSRQHRQLGRPPARPGPVVGRQLRPDRAARSLRRRRQDRHWRPLRHRLPVGRPLHV